MNTLLKYQTLLLKMSPEEKKSFSISIFIDLHRCPYNNTHLKCIQSNFSNKKNVDWKDHDYL